MKAFRSASEKVFIFRPHISTHYFLKECWTVISQLGLSFIAPRSSFSICCQSAFCPRCILKTVLTSQMSVDLSCDYTVLGFFTSQTADEMSSDLNPATDLNLSFKISAHGDWGRGGSQRWEMNEILDSRAVESLTWEKLNLFSQVIS